MHIKYRVCKEFDWSIGFYISQVLKKMKKRRVGDHKLVPLDKNPYEIRRRAIYAFLLCWEKNPLLRKCLSRDVALKIAEFVQVEIPEILQGEYTRFVQKTVVTPEPREFVLGWKTTHSPCEYYACGECKLPLRCPVFTFWDYDENETTCRSNSQYFERFIHTL